MFRKSIISYPGAAIGGAVVPPIIYLLATGIGHVVATPVSPPPPAKQDLAQPDTETPAPTPIESGPTATDTPTPSPAPPAEQDLAPPDTPTPTPTHTPTPTTPPVTSGELDAWFTKYSSEYSIDRQKLWLIAVCESKLNVNAKNGDYGGLYQFSSGTWRSTRGAMNADTNAGLRFNPEEAIKTAAFKISVSGYTSWPNCSK